MAQSVSQVMTRNPRTVRADAPVIEAARIMREADVGPVIVVEDDHVAGVVTDRDIAIRAVADGRDPSSTKVSDICSPDLTTVSPDDTIDSAVQLMREKHIRRLPVVEGGKPVGIVSIGDLAVEREPGSVLGDISAAEPNK